MGAHGIWLVGISVVWSSRLLFLGLYLPLVQGCSGERACASAEKAGVYPARFPSFRMEDFRLQTDKIPLVTCDCQFKINHLHSLRTTSRSPRYILGTTERRRHLP